MSRVIERAEHSLCRLAERVELVGGEPVGFEGLLLGTVSERVASRPVAVVRVAAPVRGGRVVAGIDGSARSLDALRWPPSKRVDRDAELDVVHATRPSVLVARPAMSPLSPYSAAEQAGQAMLDEALADPALADTRVRPHLTHDGPARAPRRRSGCPGRSRRSISTSSLLRAPLT